MLSLRRAKTAFWKARAVGFRQSVKITLQRLGRHRQRAQMDEAQAVFRVLSKSSGAGTMFDVGAHFGGSLAPFLRAGWRVFAFEPDGRNRAALGAAFGDRPNLTVDPRAVSDATRSGIALFRSPLSTGISGLSGFHPSHSPAEFVDAVTLADAITAYAVQHIDFLKVDTEGFDLMVLRGLDWLRCAPGVVMCEFEDRKTVPLGYDFHALARFLTDREYRVIVSEWHPVDHYGDNHRWRRLQQYPCELDRPSAWGNLIATRDADLYRRLQDELMRMSREVAELSGPA